jgi:hypothetical protein
MDHIQVITEYNVYHKTWILHYKLHLTTNTSICPQDVETHTKHNLQGHAPFSDKLQVDDVTGK